MILVDKDEAGKWQCPVCLWYGSEEDLKEDYYGDLDVICGSVHCSTVCPECGAWLSDVEYVV